jgi:MFS family permease
MINKINDAISCRALFFIISFYIGLWTIRIPSIKDQLHTDYIGIGYILGTFAFGSILVMIFANEILKKFPSKVAISFSGIMQGILWILVPFITELDIFMIFSFIFGCCYGIFEVAINLQASNIEKREKKSMMSGFHAFFSLGLLSGSFCTSILLGLNVSFFSNILIYVAVLLPLTILFSNFLLQDLHTSSNEKESIFFLWPPLIIVLVIITMTDSLSEGGVDSWAALYMRDAVNVDGFYIGIATISFNIFMVVGRFTGDAIRDKLGVYLFFIILNLFSIIGLIIILMFNSVFSSIVGFSVLGFGISSIIPLSYSLAGKIEGVSSTVGISIISIATYGMFMIGPAIMGFVAKFYGINNVFSPMMILFCSCLLIIIFFRKKINIQS